MIYSVSDQVKSVHFCEAVSNLAMMLIQFPNTSQSKITSQGILSFMYHFPQLWKNGEIHRIYSLQKVIYLIGVLLKTNHNL